MRSTEQPIIKQETKTMQQSNAQVNGAYFKITLKHVKASVTRVHLPKHEASLSVKRKYQSHLQ